MSTWADMKARWSSGWSTLSDTARRTYEGTISANPAAFKQTVVEFVSLLTESRASLDRSQRLLADVQDPALTQQAAGLESRYTALAAGVFADAKPVDTVGVAPLVVGGVVVAGVLVSVTGIAWSVAAYQYAVNLRENTDLLEKELEARVAASKEGRSLSPSTIPPQPSPVNQARKVGVMLLGGLTLAAAAVAVPMLLKKAG